MFQKLEQKFICIKKESFSIHFPNFISSVTDCGKVWVFFFDEIYHQFFLCVPHKMDGGEKNWWWKLDRLMNNKKIKVGKSTCLHLMRKVFVYCIKKNILEILIKNTNLFNKKAITELILYLKKNIENISSLDMLKNFFVNKNSETKFK